MVEDTVRQFGPRIINKNNLCLENCIFDPFGQSEYTNLPIQCPQLTIDTCFLRSLNRHKKTTTKTTKKQQLFVL
jgi:hypothetical protein